MPGLEIVVGAAVTVLTQIIKKLTNKIGRDWTILLVFALTFLGAYGFIWGKSLLTPEFLEHWAKVVGSQFVIWGLFVKYLGDK